MAEQRERPDRVGEAFAELVLADRTFLRAEFDAIVAANFDPSAFPSPTRPSVPAPRPPHANPVHLTPVRKVAGSVVERGARWVRQRSPPVG
ncbi:hypothetical protein SAMN05192558_101112 [Actinokineospora alba]|uniref:Uncharacterized protein n=1 Tax=Actinokineospora alba TaxID=504798 RepID=A0A1H0EUY9_9PSEU|nr:hypothetical protein [Actinokineospora alba]TDP69233.1 hypothetical protein C8E96_4809 [Actinokineospora alba]SDI21348.1 hypothetical protein SAMN05421871_103757 [Actinokineospora alba]SDN86190.1 hypothetical protein SAMN05192558_101112 [Actinokineospora alba]